MPTSARESLLREFSHDTAATEKWAVVFPRLPPERGVEVRYARITNRLSSIFIFSTMPPYSSSL